MVEPENAMLVVTTQYRLSIFNPIYSVLIALGVAIEEQLMASLTQYPSALLSPLRSRSVYPYYLLLLLIAPVGRID